MPHSPWLHSLLWFPLMTHMHIRTHSIFSVDFFTCMPQACTWHAHHLSMLSAELSSPIHLENLLETRLKSRMKPHYCLWLTFSLFVLFFSPLPAPFCHRPIMLYQILWPLEQSRRWIRCTLLLNVNNHSLTSTSEDDTLSVMHAYLPR